MNEIIKLIGDYGLLVVVIGAIGLLFGRYIPQLMNIWLDRLKTKNANNDLVLEVVRNNTNALENNTAVIQNLKEQDDMTNLILDKLNNSMCEQHKKTDVLLRDVAVIKERKEIKQ